MKVLFTFKLLHEILSVSGILSMKSLDEPHLIQLQKYDYIFSLTNPQEPNYKGITNAMRFPCATSHSISGG